MLKRIPLDNVLNLRDLGGYPIGRGQMTKWKTIFRADGIFELSENDVDFMLDYCKIKSVIDLRSQKEQTAKPNTFSSYDGIKYFNIPLISEDADFFFVNWAKIDDIYERVVDVSMNNIKAIFGAIAGSLPDPVLYHCTAGKDRTGIISVLLLGVCGVDGFDIAGDYEVSSNYIRRNIRKILAHDEQIDEEMLSSRAATVRNLMTGIDKKFGSIQNYLNKTGINNETIDKIKSNFVINY